MRISDWSSDVCSSDLIHPAGRSCVLNCASVPAVDRNSRRELRCAYMVSSTLRRVESVRASIASSTAQSATWARTGRPRWSRSEEHTSELQSLMRSSYAVLCWKKKRTQKEKKHE